MLPSNLDQQQAETVAGMKALRSMLTSSTAAAWTIAISSIEVPLTRQSACKKRQANWAVLGHRNKATSA